MRSEGDGFNAIIKSKKSNQNLFRAINVLTIVQVYTMHKSRNADLQAVSGWDSVTATYICQFVRSAVYALNVTRLHNEYKILVLI